MAKDSGKPARMARVIAMVTIEDVNDNGPVFSQGMFYGSIREDASVGSTVLQVCGFVFVSLLTFLFLSLLFSSLFMFSPLFFIFLSQFFFWGGGGFFSFVRLLSYQSLTFYPPIFSFLFFLSFSPSLFCPTPFLSYFFSFILFFSRLPISPPLLSLVL